ncbi:MAG: glycosyltransferase family 2 protein [Armatimonadota bacterium]|nr:glycosyltransferase family 2 protein [Armatimonadota bacterium]
MGISALVITWNEEKNIQRCLESLRFADEIVVLDSYSSDRTVEIAKRYTDKVFQREFAGFSDQRIAALQYASQDWVLIVDADEVVTPELASALRRAAETEQYDGYRLPRLTVFLDREMRHCGWYPAYSIRLARKDKVYFPPRLVHESILVRGRIGVLDEHLLHYSYPSLAEYARKMMLYADAGAKQMKIDGKRFTLFDLLARPPFAFFRMFIWKLGFLDGMHGFVLSVLTACSTALRYAMLWELERQSKIENGKVNNARSRE